MKHKGCSLLSAGAPFGAVQRDTLDETSLRLRRGPSAVPQRHGVLHTCRQSPHHLSTTITHEHPNRPEGQDSRMPLPTPVAVPPGTRMVNTAEAAAQAHPHSNGLLNDLEVLKDKYSLKKSSLHSGIEHIYHQLQRHKQKLRRLLKGQAVETVIS